MQTIYTTSSCLAARSKIVDLSEYRRRMDDSAEQSREDLEVSPLLWDRERSARREPAADKTFRRTRRAAGVSAWFLDICASAGVLAMTLAFTVTIL